MEIPKEICCICVPEEERYLNRLRQQLHLLVLRKEIIFWAITDIRAGEESKRAIQEHLERAPIIIFLISPSFVVSKDHYEMMEKALQRHKRKEAHIIPIMVHPIDKEKTPLGELQFLPKNGRAMSLSKKSDNVYYELVEELKRVIQPNPLPAGNSGNTLASQPPARSSGTPNPLPAGNKFLSRLLPGILLLIILGSVIFIIFSSHIFGIGNSPRVIVPSNILVSPTSISPLSPTSISSPLVTSTARGTGDLSTPQNVINQWCEYALAGNFQSAYDQLFTPHLKGSVTVDDLQKDFENYYECQPGSLTIVGNQATVVVTLQAQPYRAETFTLLRIQGQWKINDFATG